MQDNSKACVSTRELQAEAGNRLTEESQQNRQQNTTPDRKGSHTTIRLLRNSLRDALRMLERSAVKVASCVLMVEGSREAPDLPDYV